MNNERFADRSDAGRCLADHLAHLRGIPDLLVLALPRGGVPVAHQAAMALEAPMDIFLVRKLGAPWNEELAIGAIAEGGQRVLNQHVINRMGVTPFEIDAIVRKEERELDRRAWLYRNGQLPARVAGASVVLVDDGLATGASMVAAVKACRKFLPQRIVVAVPVAPPETCEYLEQFADEVVCPRQPLDFSSVGSWYDDFTQTTDDEVRAIMSLHRPVERAVANGLPLH